MSFLFRQFFSFALSWENISPSGRHLFSRLLAADNVVENYSRTEAVEEVLIDSIKVLNNSIGNGQA